VSDQESSLVLLSFIFFSLSSGIFLGLLEVFCDACYLTLSLRILVMSAYLLVNGIYYTRFICRVGNPGGRALGEAIQPQIFLAPSEKFKLGALVSL
jgi:hypothetical protein